MTEQLQMNPEARIIIEETSDSPHGLDMFVEFDGKRIAKRGHHGTPQAMTWIALEPGYVVTSSRNHMKITIEHDGVCVCRLRGLTTASGRNHRSRK